MTGAATRLGERSGRSQRALRKARSKRNARLGLVLGLMVAVVASGIHVVFTSHQLREMHTMLETTRQRHDALLAEHSRLLLERGALAAYQHVERVAEAELDMQFPNKVEQILP